MNKKTIKDVDVSGKRVLVRVDFNVPITQGAVADDRKIQAALPTIQYLLGHGASLILMSHLGRPQKGPDPRFAMDPVAERLSQLMGAEADVEAPRQRAVAGRPHCGKG